MKICSKCKVEKPLTAFRTDKRGTRNVCIKCRDYHQLIAVHGRKRWIKEGKEIPTNCECCGKEAKLCYDHDHNTEQHRGWICQQCNQGISLLGDNLHSLQNAIRYLSKHDQRRYTL
jgi:hypothetical protein